MDIEPDTKDWTWVLTTSCPECGLVASDIDPAIVADLVRAAIPRWEAVLRRDDARERPASATWSPTEYACHVRDVFAVFGQRVQLMLDEDDPLFANWDQDVTAIEDDYASQRPADVAPALVAAGEAAAARFASVPGDAWERRGRRSNGSTFTVATLAQYFWHDIAHHLHDVSG